MQKKEKDGMKLFNAKTGHEVTEGQWIKDFRGDTWAFVTLTLGGRRVLAKPAGDTLGSGKNGREFFPSVFPGYEVREK